MAVEQNNSFIVNNEFNPAILRTVLIRSWFWIVFIFALSLSVVFIYLRYSKPVYESSAVIQIVHEDPGADVIGIENLNNRKKSLSKEIQLLNSQYLFGKAIRALNLNISYFAKGEFLTEERYLQSTFNITPFALLDSSLCNTPIFLEHEEDKFFLKYVHRGIEFKERIIPNEYLKNERFEIILKLPKEENLFNELNENQLYFEFNGLNNLVNRFLPDFNSQALNVEAQTINLTHKSNNPVLSRDIVQAVINAFFNYDESLKRESSDKILGFIEVQLDSLVKELNASKDSVMAYQRREDVSSVETLSSSLSSKLNSLQDELYSTEEGLLILSNLSSKLENSPNRLEIYQLIPVLLGKSFQESLSSQVADLHDLLEKREDMMYSVTPENKGLQRIDQRIEVRLSSINKIISTLTKRLIEKSEKLKRSIADLELAYYDIPEKRMELSRLKNMQELNEKYYTLFTEKKVLY